ncbi:glutathione S-transferase C-terminal domain-containing protein [Novosphingobium sp. JCM 18896]|uniref:glutathione S-transferase C-terminal domain-containing protein n=1 Tax=Novosphingobium sp. JCM 18896 TaxID=2989731 RepID=UPI002222BF22|nr:glutathione S-transferase C-terminal domain-containing protein [Novosphingobium sp. JCM 18896]MCW1432313.1 glutathione S-transferase N-terminal domain-containing protein [Novosphingobium sp. JCM 18896]
MIDLHYVATSNGLKIAIALEEMELEYRAVTYELFSGDHLAPSFKAINPNHKLPAIVDLDPIGGGPPFSVFETGAILLYLAEKTGLFASSDPRSRSTITQWLVWQVAGLGPMLGQAYHFVRYAPEGQDYPVDRYRREARRLLHVLDRQLRDSRFVAGDYSIADMACWPWVQNIGNIDLSFDEFPSTRRWSEFIGERPAVVRALAQGSIPGSYLKRRMTLTSEQWSRLFGNDLLNAASQYD